MKKPVLTKAQAEAIELAKREDHVRDVVGTCAGPHRWGGSSGFVPLNDLDLDTLMSALVNGYEIEKSAEELRENTLREYYCDAKYQMATNGLAGLAASHAYAEGRAHAIERTLEILGIKIEGVNA